MQIEQSENAESKHLKALLAEVYEILNAKKKNVEADKEIGELLEKIIELRDNREDVQQVFNQVLEQVAAMIDGNFSKRIHIPASQPNTNSILQYLATTFNVLAEELESRLIPKELTSDIVNQLSTSTLVIVTDLQGKILYGNHNFEEHYESISIELSVLKIQEIFKEMQEPFLLDLMGTVKNLKVKLPEGKTGRLNASVSETTSLKEQRIIFLVEEVEPESKLVKRVRKTQELENLLDEYHTIQNIWLEIGTHLSAAEVLSIENMLKNGSAEGDKNQHLLVEKTYQQAIEKLNYTFRYFDKWVLNKASLLKRNDREKAFSNYQDFPLVPASDFHQKEVTINGLLAMYNEQWQNWVNNGVCISKKEELAIEHYLNYRSHKVLADKLEMPENTVIFTYNQAVQKVRFSVQRFHSWIMARAWEINKNALNEDPASGRFLKTPLKEFGLPAKTINALKMMGINTPEELISQATLESLSKLNGLGKNAIKGVIKLFEQHNCAHLLKNH